MFQSFLKWFDCLLIKVFLSPFENDPCLDEQPEPEATASKGTYLFKGGEDDWKIKPAKDFGPLKTPHEYWSETEARKRGE